MLASAAMDSYTASASYEDTLKRLRRALSRHGFEILRECDVGWRVSMRGAGSSAHCRILYLTEPELFAIAISTDPSAALWLPVPVVVWEREERVKIFRPAEGIVRDRAALLGVRALVERSYQKLTGVLEMVGSCDSAANQD
jgi:uncharacterized protein (DUF302 family)